MEQHAHGAAVSHLCRKCARCGPDLGFHSDASGSGDRRDHRDLRLACSIPPGRQEPSNLNLLGQNAKMGERERIFRTLAGGLDALLPLTLLGLLFPKTQLLGSAFQATSHGAAHGAFMTLPSYAIPGADEMPHPGRGPQSCRVGL